MPRPSHLVGRWLVLGLLASCLCGVARAADPIPIVATPVALDPNNPGHTTLGRLIYRGGLILESSDKRFGGWSDLHVSADGSRLVAISDHGFWLTAKIGYDAAGRPAALADARLGPLIDPAGRALAGRTGDAEGLAARPDGGFYVSFERFHRIWLYPKSDPPFSAPPQPVPTPVRLATAPDNGGIEALGRLADGSLLALVEELMDGDEHVGWIDTGALWHELHYRAGDEFKPTGIAELPAEPGASGDVLVLERRFTFLSGLGARIVRLPRRAIVAGAHLQGEELARLQQPLTVDNFEGIAAIRGPNGAATLFLISDDNYSMLQRTLLLTFELPPSPSVTGPK